jgi:hypothetical protein
MYRRSKTLNSEFEDLSNYIEGSDVYNSVLLTAISDPNLYNETYEITVYEYRPDLIAKDFYGSSKYLGLLLVQCPPGLDTYKRGNRLKLISKTTLDNILSKIK